MKAMVFLYTPGFYIQNVFKSNLDGLHTMVWFNWGSHPRPWDALGLTIVLSFYIMK